MPYKTWNHEHTIFLWFHMHLLSLPLLQLILLSFLLPSYAGGFNSLQSTEFRKGVFIHQHFPPCEQDRSLWLNVVKLPRILCLRYFSFLSDVCLLSLPDQVQLKKLLVSHKVCTLLSKLIISRCFWSIYSRCYWSSGSFTKGLIPLYHPSPSNCNNSSMFISTWYKYRLVIFEPELARNIFCKLAFPECENSTWF